MSMAVDTFSNMAQRIDPDIQATLSDFLTYTEHFPAHLIRALTLIQSETIRTEKKIAAIHADTTLYSLLPTLPPNERKDPIQLRRDISYALEEAERAGRMRLEEASRLADTAVREQARLAKLVDKLKAIPLPSRDPTPEDEGALTSPNLSRTARFGVEITGDRSARRLLDKAAGKLRARKIIVPGEVLPPPDPNAPPDTFSDWSSSESEEERRITPRPRSRTPKLKYDRSDREERDRKAARPRGPRLPGQPGTNAHSAVAGISTSNALLALNPPPADAQPGSKWLPWTKLTEWELAKLRKRMKKNAIWVPSATMVRRELKLLGRGITGREAARATAESGGPAFVDESTEPDPTRLFSGQPLDQAATPAPPIVLLEGDDADDEELINRGMRLNEAKKLKRARLLEEQREAAEQIAREQAESPEAVVVKSPETSKKRKRESTPIKQQETKAESPDLLRAAPPSRRIKLNNTTEDNAPEINTTLKPAGNERRKTSTPPAAARRATITIKAAKAASEEPQNRRTSLRRGSNVSILNDNLIPARVKGTTRKNKRPAPGVIKTDDEESARVSNSKRKAAPRKRGSKQAVEKTLEIQEEEHIDPNEPRYCICGDVSWGTMIACENEGNCEKEWFHLSCIGLDDLPPRRTKWYCPDCRKKLKIGQSSNGLVGK